VAKKDSTKEVSGWAGWAAFAGILSVLVGTFQAIAGIVALFKDEVVFFGVKNIWLLDLTSWGWVHLVGGLLLILVGYGILTGQTWARVMGVLLAGLSAVWNFAWLPVYPVWSLVVISRGRSSYLRTCSSRRRTSRLINSNQKYFGGT
jgi:hypothetical protein